MERLEKYICVAVAALLLMAGGYVLGWRVHRCAPPPAETAVRTDTLRIRDTLIIDRPVPVEVRVVDTMLVAVVDTVQVRVRDTVQVMVQVPREVRVYSDSAYRAQVSGYRPSLDWIEVYPQTTVVTRNIYADDSRKRWGIGVQAGQMVLAGSSGVVFSPYAGAEISFSFKRWKAHIRAGYSAYSMDGRAKFSPYGELGVTYDLIRF